MQRSWLRILALTMGIPLLLAILVACGSSTGRSSGNTPTAHSTMIRREVGDLRNIRWGLYCLG